MADEQTPARTTVTPAPYVPWRTFKNFVDGLGKNMPSRIDTSLMGTMAGSTQGQLKAALRFMDFVTENGTPTQKLRDYVKAEGEDRVDALGAALQGAYASILKDVDLESGTYKQLSEALATTGAQGDTLRKAVAFYLLAAKDAKLELSSHFNSRGSRSATAPRRRRATGGRQVQQLDEEYDAEAGLPARSKFEILMEKFPAFDPTWPIEVQTKWFDAFDRVQKMGEGGGE